MGFELLLIFILGDRPDEGRSPILSAPESDDRVSALLKI
jgi:hypothetical protein